jgi:hypothetical protein
VLPKLLTKKWNEYPVPGLPFSRFAFAALAKSINAGQKATEVTNAFNQILPRNSLKTSALGRNFRILKPAGIPVALTGYHGPI